jgi:NADH:ubiquinone oxidoreductase subunit
MEESQAVYTSYLGMLNNIHLFHRRTNMRHGIQIWHFVSRQDDLKVGTLVGEDKYGNRYYENNMYFYGL